MELKTKLHQWIDQDSLYWRELSSNPNAIKMLEATLNRIDWYDNINWRFLLKRPSKSY